MTRPPPPAGLRLPDLILLLLTLALAAGARVGYLAQHAGNATTAGPLQVQDGLPELLRSEGARAHSVPTEQDALIDNMKSHHWFGCTAPLAPAEERTAHVAPGYPWLIGELERLLGNPAQIEPLVRWMQCGLGTLTAVLYFLFALQAFGSRLAAGLAGVLCALHPFYIVNTAAINDGVLATFLLAAGVFLGTRAGAHGGALTSLLYGLVLAGLALVRAALLPFAAVALFWFLLRCRRLPHGWLAALLSFLGFATGLAPWTLRNLDAFNDVYPIVDSTYYHLWMGNNPQATGGPQQPHDLIAALATTRNEEPGVTAGWLAKMDQPERYRALAEPTLKEVLNAPQETLQRRLWATLSFLVGEDFLTHRKLWRDVAYLHDDHWETPESGPYPLLLTASLLGMLLLGVIGWRLTYAWRHAAMPATLAALFVPLPYMLSHAEVLSGPRLPLDGVLLSFAAFAVACLFVPRLLGNPTPEE